MVWAQHGGGVRTGNIATVSGPRQQPLPDHCLTVSSLQLLLFMSLVLFVSGKTNDTLCAALGRAALIGIEPANPTVSKERCQRQCP